MTDRRRILSTFVFVAALVAAVVVGWCAHALFGVEEKKPGVAKTVDPSVAVGEVRLELFNPPDTFVGHIEPVREVDILPQIEGYLKEMKFNEGDLVKEGDLLYLIDDERYLAEEGVALAELAQAKAKVEVAESAVDRSERYLRRLSAADERGITAMERDSAETQLAADRAALASARATVSQAEAGLATVRFNLKHTRVLAPISGRIGKSLRHSGDYVSPSKDPLARIVQEDPVRVTFPLTDRAFLGWNGEMRRLRLRLADGSLYAEEGQWGFIDNEMSAETATLIVRAEFPNPRRTLIPNAYVTVLTDDADPRPVPVIPFLALAKSAKSSGVWIVDGDDRVSFREIVAGATSDGLIRVLSGVTAGERIVVQGVHKLAEGQRVNIVPASEFR